MKLKADGSVLINTKIDDSGLEEGFHRLANGMDSVADQAQRMGRDIASAFSDTNVASEVDSIRKQIQSLEEQMESVTAEQKISLAEGDDNGVARLERRMTSLYGRLEEARQQLASEVEKEANRQAGAEEKAIERYIKATESASDQAQQMGRDISSAFSFEVPANNIERIEAQIKTLAQRMSDLRQLYEIATKEGDDKGAAQLENKMTSLYDRLQNARYRLSQEIKKEADRQAVAEERAAQQSIRAAEREAKEKERAAQKAVRAAEKEARAEEKSAERSIKAAEKEAKEKERLAKKQADIALRPIQRFKSRISEIITGALFFNIVSAGIREMTRYFGEALKTNDQYTNSVAKLKGALLTAFQPIYEYVVPAIIYMIDFMTTAIEVVGRFFATLAGKEYSQMQKNAEAMYNEAKGIKAVGDSAEKAKKQLMGFDEINRLSNQNESTSTTTSSGASDTIKPVFEASEVTEEMETILQLVRDIAVALLAWKIGSYFTSGLAGSIALLVAIGAAFAYGYNWADAFENGINWDNLFNMFLSMIVLAGALAIAFGPTAAAIALLVTGIGLIILAMKEWIETGEISDAALAALVIGIGAVGIAIGILTGSWIPLLVAAVVALVAVIVARGDEIKAALNKFSDWLKNIFGRDWTELFGVTLGTALNALFGVVGGVLNGLKEMFFGLIDFLTGVFTGNWELAWQGICNIVKGAINGVIGIVNGMIAAVVNGINAVFRLLSFNLELPNGSVIGWTLPQFTPPQIPLLAQGAVIPPNAPFMAVLGDQKHGTNIEAPADLIRQIIREELANGATSDEVAALLRELIQVVLGIHIGDETIGKAAARYNRRTSRAGGY